MKGVFLSLISFSFHSVEKCLLWLLLDLFPWIMRRRRRSSSNWKTGSVMLGSRIFSTSDIFSRLLIDLFLSVINFKTISPFYGIAFTSKCFALMRCRRKQNKERSKQNWKRETSTAESAVICLNIQVAKADPKALKWSFYDHLVGRPLGFTSHQVNLSFVNSKLDLIRLASPHNRFS